MKPLQIFLTACFSLLPLFAFAAEADVSFSRQIQPLLARRCFACHGPDEDERQADLRLDLRDAAIEGGAIEPGKPAASALISRVASTDLDERMPPAGHKPLAPAEIDQLRQWIKAGAVYEPHWAFIPPKRPALPAVKDRQWPHNAVDHFVLARIEQAGLKPSPRAEKLTLARRLYLDLTGLPPTPQQADAFAADDRHDAYQRLVDHLLSSPRYGERWGRKWLDVARYSDTNGYEKDRPRTIWPYRDWVIRALNSDMPFSQFTLEQIAGDMLPDATASQRIATGFHRNTMLNEEGGIDPLEYRYYAMVDRVATTSLVWMGVTMGCAQCHSHKYDPLSHSSYFRFMGLLNNAEEPDFPAPTAAMERRSEELRQKIKTGMQDLAKHLPAFLPQYKLWLQQNRQAATKWKVLRPAALKSNLPHLQLLDDGSVLSTGDITKRDEYRLSIDLKPHLPPKPAPQQITAIRLEVLPDQRLPAGGPGRAFYEGRKGDFFLSEVTATLDSSTQPIKFSKAAHTYGKISIGNGAAATNVFDGNGSTGWSTSGREGERHQLLLTLAEPLPARGRLNISLLFERHFAAALGRFRLSATTAKGDIKPHDVPAEVETLLHLSDKDLSPEQSEKLQQHFLLTSPALAALRKPIELLKKQLPHVPQTMVMQQREFAPPRKTFRHHRGEYLSPKEEVTPAVPEIFRQGAAPEPTDRLTLGRWLASPANPLAARAAVNRAWRDLTGSGLVNTGGDFGVQSEPPSHPQLLDWLAVEFMENGWSLKHLHRTIVLSATYQQDSRLRGGAAQRFAQGSVLNRGNRFRLDGEIVRDSLLHASGLLTTKMGGPGVYPPQTASVTALAYGGMKWQASVGADRYRRSIYTFSKRTAPFAAYAVYDAPSGENCVVRRNRGNTPLQSLTLLNDPMYTEMARALAALAVNSQTSDTQRATFIFRRLMIRQPGAAELKAIISYYHQQLTRLKNGALKPGQVAADKGATAELAAWVLVARSLMNLDETITRE